MDAHLRQNLSSEVIEFVLGKIEIWCYSENCPTASSCLSSQAILTFCLFKGYKASIPYKQ